MSSVITKCALLFIVSSLAFSNNRRDTLKTFLPGNPHLISIGVVGHPYPSLFGISLAYKIFEFTEVQGTLGFVGVSAGLNGFIPEWNLTPVVGVHGSYTLLGGVWGGVIYQQIGLRLRGFGNEVLESGLLCKFTLFQGDYSACGTFFSVGLFF